MGRRALVGVAGVALAAALSLGACEAKTGPGPAGAGTGADAAGDTRRPHVAFVTNGVAGFWTIAAKGARDGGAAADVDVSVHMPAEGITEQKRMLEDLVTRGVDGVAVSPIDPANQTETLNMVATETNLITHDSDAPQSERLCYVGMDNYTAGRMAGQLVKEALPDGGKVFIFIGRLEQDNAKGRRQGVIDELLGRSHDPSRYDPPSAQFTGGTYEILGTLTDQFDRALAKANAEDALTRYPDLDCMVGLFEYNPPAMLAALEQAGKLREVQVIGFDEAEETLAGILAGTVHGTVVQDPYNYGYKSVEMLAALARGDDSVIPEDRFVNIPARQIRADNVEAFWADLKSKLGETPAGG
ncbi:MAG: sugar-binding protein [Phycisphaerales bacterium JB039]